jgi:hypothetical protein
MAEPEYMITTIDNPFNPFNQFESWMDYDVLHGHDCCGMLGRYANVSDELSDAENEEELNDAIGRIIVRDPLNIYRRVTPEDYENGSWVPTPLIDQET